VKKIDRTIKDDQDLAQDTYLNRLLDLSADSADRPNGGAFKTCDFQGGREKVFHEGRVFVDLQQRGERFDIAS
jgi:hypothetical protein